MSAYGYPYGGQPAAAQYGYASHPYQQRMGYGYGQTYGSQQSLAYQPQAAYQQSPYAAAAAAQPAYGYGYAQPAAYGGAAAAGAYAQPAYGYAQRPAMPAGGPSYSQVSTDGVNWTVDHHMYPGGAAAAAPPAYSPAAGYGAYGAQYGQYPPY
jgi:hypothetical protein